MGPGNNTAPTAAFTAACTGLSCTFTDLSTDSDGTVTSWNWSFGDGASSNAPSPSHTYNAAGLYNVILAVTDNRQATDDSTRVVAVDMPNQAPQATISAPGNGTAFPAGSAVTFTGSASDPEDGALTGAALVWASNVDGALGTGTSVTTSALSTGPHTITLRATDSQLAADTASITITISAAAGSRIVFESNRTGTWQLHVMNADGSGSQQLTHESLQPLGHPAWAPSGSTIAFMMGLDLYIMNADGSGVDRLVSGVASERYPTWSPNSLRIAFRTTYTSGLQSLNVINADGTGLQELIGITASYGSISWDPTNTYIAFSSVGGGVGGIKQRIFLVGTDGNPALSVIPNTDANANNVDPAFSPDGQQLAFASDRNSIGEYVYDIYVYSFVTRQLTQLTFNSSDNRYPAWSANSEYIAFVSTRDGNGEVYVMKADGSGPRNLTLNPASDGRPSWSP